MIIISNRLMSRRRKTSFEDVLDEVLKQNGTPLESIKQLYELKCFEKKKGETVTSLAKSIKEDLDKLIVSEPSVFGEEMSKLLVEETFTHVKWRGTEPQLLGDILESHTIYHGTTYGELKNFVAQGIVAIGTGNLGNGFYFTDKPSTAYAYARSRAATRNERAVVVEMTIQQPETLSVSTDLKNKEVDVVRNQLRLDQYCIRKRLDLIRVTKIHVAKPRNNSSPPASAAPASPPAQPMGMTAPPPTQLGQYCILPNLPPLGNTPSTLMSHLTSLVSQRQRRSPQPSFEMFGTRSPPQNPPAGNANNKDSSVGTRSSTKRKRGDEAR